jgi:hypothetical protein
MAKHLCPYGHSAVVRQDPDSEGLVGQCDVCGWSAPYVVARGDQDWQAEGGELANRQLADESERGGTAPNARQIAAGEPEPSPDRGTQRRK